MRLRSTLRSTLPMRPRRPPSPGWTWTSSPCRSGQPRVARRLVGPRTGVRITNTQPTLGTGLPPMSRPVVEQPLVVAVELLERVVREHRGVDLVGDLQHEGVAAADGAGRRRDELAGEDRLLERRRSRTRRCGGRRWRRRRRSPRARGARSMNARDGLVELREARRGAAFGGDVRAVDDDVGLDHVVVSQARVLRHVGRHRFDRLAQPDGASRRSRVTAYAATTGRVHRRGHRPPAAAHPQRVRERRHAETRATRRAASTCSRATSKARASTSSATSRARAREPRRPHRGHATRRADAAADGPHRRRAGQPRRLARDPFGGELVDGEVWGRGAVDMLNLTASMAVAIAPARRRRVPARGHADLPRRRRRGGARRLRRRAPGSSTSPTPSRADYVITESGGIPMPSRRRA